LNVGAILEGSVRKAGDRLRITAQLIDVADGYHLWSERYDRTLEDIFAIQDEVTAAIIDNLKLKLVTRENEAVFKRPRANLEAHNLYLKGIHYLRMYASRGFEAAIDCFQQAVEQDPGYAAAFYGLSDAYVQVAFWGGLPPSEACRKAKDYAKKALELDPTLGDAHGTLSYVHTIHDWNWQAAERESLEALRLGPSSAMCHLTRSWYLSNTERHEEAVAEAFEAQRLDPVSSFINTFPGVALIMQRQFARAIEELETAKKMNPDFYLIRSFLGMAYYANGDYEEAVKEHQKATEISGGAAWMAMNLELALSQMGKREEADRLFEELKVRSETEYLPPVGFFLIHLERGNLKEAFRWLEKAGQMHDTYLSWIRISPKEIVRTPTEPRFKTMMKKAAIKAMIGRIISRYRIGEAPS
jgi:tetratricopeptide (TPR) repeat protein